MVRHRFRGMAFESREWKLQFPIQSRRLEGRSWLQDLDNTINQIPHWILWSGLAAFIVLVFAFMVLFAWLRARGRFILLIVL